MHANDGDVDGKFFIFAGANMKKKKEKKKEKRGRRRKEKKREKKKMKSIFIFQHVTDETAMAPKNAMHQYSQYWTTLPPSYILSTQFVCLIQDCFRGKPLPQEFLYSILCLIPKTERGKMQGIVLLEVCYKVISSIILTRIEDAITWHPGIHHFRHKRGTGTCILEAKLRVQ
jgi:hypothetical protein